MQDIDSNIKIPNHVAIIMDGNGRWAKKRGLPRTVGHKNGAEAVRRIVNAAADLGVEYLTLFGFSSENWSRPEDEVSELMRLLRYYLRAETAELHKNGVRLRVIGDRTAFSKDILELIENAETLTADNGKINLTIALNYGGQHDILQAAYRLAKQAIEAGEVEDLDNFGLSFEENLMTAGMPNPDLLIRTSGEQRISNFLLWQCAYSEMVFTETLWPDFGQAELGAAIEEYAGRDRRFGSLKQSEG